MKVVVQNLVVDMDMVTKVGKQVWSWEVPVLEAKYGGGKVRLQDTAEIEIQALPDPAEEYQRMGRAHGKDSGDGGTNMSFVELAYGRGVVGLKALAKEVKGCVAKKSRRKPAAKPKPAPTGDGDPLDLG